MSSEGDMRHGGALDIMRAQFPNAPAPWIDLSTGINPWPWQVPSALTSNESIYSQLPTQTDTAACRAAMSEAFGADQGHILPVPGTAMAISLLPSLLNAKRVCVLSGSYGDHLRAWKRSGAHVVEHTSPLDMAGKVDVIALCNPNNPDGRVFKRSDLLEACAALGTHGGTLIVDEAYADLDQHKSVASGALPKNLIVLRSFGKFYGWAGLRLGAVLGHPATLEALSAYLGDWPVSTLALKIGSLAYRDTAFQQETRNTLAQARLRLDDILTTCRIAIAGGTDLFRFVEVSSSESLWRHLASTGIYARRFNWSPVHLRLGLPSSKSFESRLRAALMTWEAP